MARSDDDDASVPTIQQLVADALDGDASAQKIATAMGITRQRVYQIKGGGSIKSWPKVSNVEPLAAALKVSPTTVLLAYAKTLGIPVRQTGSRLAAVLPPAAERLTPKQIAALRILIDAMTEPDADERPATVTPLPRRPVTDAAARRVARRPSTPKQGDEQ